jgi:hypothetical protein
LEDQRSHHPTQFVQQQNITGILWQGRFFSSPLDEQYTYYDFAYVENNVMGSIRKYDSSLS